MSQTLLDRLNSHGPKRILTLDGGGVRGAVALGYLKKLETLLREQHGDKHFVLSDYFDLVGGTSTGSILASCISIGMPVDEIKSRYFDVIGKIFGTKYSQWTKLLPGKGAQKIVDVLFSKADYDSGPIEEALQGMFKDITLGSTAFKSGLCIVAKRADTNSTWPLINHPGGKYFDSAEGKNKDILLWKAVRASAAAPTYFIPQQIDVGGGAKKAAFIDGGMSMANNPALQTLMVATLKGFPFKWNLGAENIMLVSIGTGMNRISKNSEDIVDYPEFKWASEIPDMLMYDASWLNQVILQWMSESPIPWHIDGEIGNLEGDLLHPGVTGRGLISYLRYNAWLSKPDLEALMEKEYTTEHVDLLNQMDHAENCNELFAIAAKAANKEMHPDHFSERFMVHR